MAALRHPGPLGAVGNDPVIDPGTLASVASPLPGPIGQHSLAQPASVAAMPAEDAEIEALDLATTARTAAYALKEAHPSIKFTSGRRGKAEQARAMASNVVSNRKWIEQTYKQTALRRQCQDWVDTHASQKTQAEIARGLLQVFDAASDEELGTLSKHLSGMAFDVQPVEHDAAAIKKTLRSLPGLDLFLDTEGGLVRWHAQF